MTSYVLLSCAASVLAWPAASVTDLRLRTLVAAGRLGSPRSRADTWSVPQLGRTAVCWSVLTAGCLAAMAAGLAVGLTVAIIVALAVSALGRVQLRRRRDRHDRATVRALSMLHAELACGSRPGDAFDAAAQTYASGRHGVVPLELSASVRDVHAGRSVSDALADSTDPVWSRVGLAWRLAEKSGAPLASVIDSVKRDLVACVTFRRILHSGTAGARASAAMVSMLPALGIVLGNAMGADPLGLLLTTPAGHLLLLAGVVFNATGVLLTRGILRTGDSAPDAAELPLLLELIASGLRSGQPVEKSMEVVTSDGSIWATYLNHVSGLLQLGAEPKRAWRQAAGAPQLVRLKPSERETIETLAQVAVRSAHSGAAMAANLTELAQQLRAEYSAVATAKAERAATLVIAPLGLCFLPSFVCVGIIPTVFGISSFVMKSLVA